MNVTRARLQQLLATLRRSRAVQLQLAAPPGPGPGRRAAALPVGAGVGREVAGAVARAQALGHAQGLGEAIRDVEDLLLWPGL